MKYDVVVMGSGVAGSAAAWFCSQRGQKVALVDKAKFPRDKICTSTINPRSCTYLQQLGVLQNLQGDGLVRVRGIQTFSYEGRCFRGWYEARAPYLDYGHTIPRHRLDQELLDCARRQRSVDCYQEFEIKDADAAAESVTVLGESGGRAIALTARLAIDATGRGSPIGRKRGIFEPWSDHRRFAVIAQFSGVAKVEPFFNVGTNDEIGPGYFCVFPISDDVVIVSLMLTERDWSRMQADPAGGLESFVRGEWILRDWFRMARMTTPVAAFGPLAFKSRALQLDRILMAGDTTGFYDPLTGEGITFAFRSAELAAEGASRLCGGSSWAEVAAWYEQSVRTEKELALEQAVQLQRMLKLREAFNRFVATLSQSPPAANWLACSLGNLVPPAERSVDHFKLVLQSSHRGEISV